MRRVVVFLLFGSCFSFLNGASGGAFLNKEVEIEKEKVLKDFEHKSQKAYRSPIVATSAIIEVYDEQGSFQGIVLIQRCNPPLGKALPGGLVEYGETLEQTLSREMLEETSLSIYDVQQFYAYSNPKRDPRFHVIDVVHVAKAKGQPKGSTDAAKAWVISLDAIPWSEIVFDHADILKDYLKWRTQKGAESFRFLGK